MPTSFAYVSTPMYTQSSFLLKTDAMSTMFDMPLRCYYASTAGLTDVSQLTMLASTTLSAVSGQANIANATMPAGVLYFYIQITDLDGVVGSVVGNATPITISGYYPTSFTFTAPTDCFMVEITRTTGTTDSIPTEVYYGMYLGITSIAGLTKFGSGSWPKTETTTFSSTDGAPFPYDTTLYLYVRCPATSDAVLGNAEPIWIAYGPTSFTFIAPTYDFMVDITRTTGTADLIPTEVYYGTEVGITSIAGLTKFGSVDWGRSTMPTYSNTNTDDTPFPLATTVYLYVRCPATSDTVLGNAAPIWFESTSFTFAEPMNGFMVDTTRMVEITRTTGTTDHIHTEVYYSTEVGITSIAGLTKFGSGFLGKSTPTRFVSDDGTPFPYDTTLYLYMRCPTATSYSVSGNSAPIRIAYGPTAFTFTVPTTQTWVEITRTTGTLDLIPTEVYYGTEIGITSIAGLTKFGSGSWEKSMPTWFFSTDGTPFPLETTLYLYVRCPATSDAVLGNATSFML
jgi:hypothetical protein